MSQPLRGGAAPRQLQGGILGCLLALAAHGDAGANALLTGTLRHPGERDVAVLTHNGKKSGGNQYSVIVFPNIGSGQPAKVVKTFIDTGPNAPRLSLVKPGSYKPACHAGGPCAPVKISSEALSLCFGEASCEIIYFDGGTFRELVVTD